MENRKTAKKLTPKANEIVRVVRDMSEKVLRDRLIEIIAESIQQYHYEVNNIVELAPLISDAVIKELGPEVVVRSVPDVEVIMKNR